MIDKVHVCVLLECFGCHQIHSLFFLIKQNLDGLKDVKVFKLELLEKLAMEVIRQLDLIKLGLVEC